MIKRLVSSKAGLELYPLWKASAFLAMAALVLHFTIVFLISLIGTLNLLPTMIDTYGTAKFITLDAVRYHHDTAQQSRIFINQGIWDTLVYPTDFHTKVYAVSFALFDPFSDYNILSAEPANALIYLLILVLVYQLGREAFDRRVGLLAACLVAVWPSFLLHTTQLLKEPQFVAAMLGLVLVSLSWLSRVHSLLTCLVFALLGSLSLIMIWLIRGEVWEVSFLIILIGGCLLLLRQLQEKRLLTYNLLGFALLLIFAFCIPRFVSRYSSFETQTRIEPDAESANVKPATSWLSMPKRITAVRQRYINSYPVAGSNVDTNIELRTMSDMVRYLPRAAIIGFFSPFPDMWFATGTLVGRKGRLLSGLETLLMYLVELFAAYGLWCARHRLSAWLLLAASTVGAVALGLVIINVSIIYRLRYAFWILLIVLGAEGGLKLCQRLFQKCEAKESVAVSSA
jgi:hypothetical protein